MVHIKPSHTTTLAQCCMDIALLPICSPQYSLGRAIHVRRNSHMLSEAKGSCTHRVFHNVSSRPTQFGPLDTKGILFTGFPVKWHRLCIQPFPSNRKFWIFAIECHMFLFINGINRISLIHRDNATASHGSTSSLSMCMDDPCLINPCHPKQHYCTVHPPRAS